jgi:hypothetical protein
MSDAPSPSETEALEKMWRLFNLQADTALKMVQTRYEPWKVVIPAMAAGGVLGGAFVALVRFTERAMALVVAS